MTSSAAFCLSDNRPTRSSCIPHIVINIHRLKLFTRHRMDRGYYRQTRPEMLAFLPKRRTAVLEIGCGEGMFAASIEGATETWGIELDSEAAHAASSRLHKVINAGFDEASDVLPMNYFDVIICNDVIEHMIDHDSFFKKIQNTFPTLAFWSDPFQILNIMACYLAYYFLKTGNTGILEFLTALICDFLRKEVSVGH